MPLADRSAIRIEARGLAPNTLADRIPLLQGITAYSLLGDWIGWFCAVLSVFCIVRVVRVPKPREEADRAQDERAGKQQGKRSPARKPPARQR